MSKNRIADFFKFSFTGKIEKEKRLYCERFVELMIDLLVNFYVALRHSYFEDDYRLLTKKDCNRPPNGQANFNKSLTGSCCTSMKC